MKIETIKRHGFTCTVYVHDTQSEMLEHIEGNYGAINPTGGGFTWCNYNQYDVHFARDVLYMCTVAHEFCHVAQHHADYIGADGLGVETAPTIIEDLTRIFWNRMKGLPDECYLLVNDRVMEGDFVEVKR